jgi:hypothetical protein
MAVGGFEGIGSENPIRRSICPNGREQKSKGNAPKSAAEMQFKIILNRTIKIGCTIRSSYFSDIKVSE